ncbi:hypothetical protein SteCoe_17288 [Stentor coeruleus]|uniref:Uncharacterized protein n=1 Tax=Stentor coeruleus TaxID=5963 RepID=A0A1R2BZA2_9CILI|nr:hypothetical protein SteCoe_17288 [Stentor coeruleus]
MIFIKILYACLLVFTIEKPYTVPIVISIMNLILCNKYTVSYIVSIRPYVYLYDMIIVLFEIIIEIIFLFFPMIYSVNTISDMIIDSLVIGILLSGILVLQFKAYFNAKDPKSLTSVLEEKNQTAKIVSENDGQYENSKDEILDMSSDEKNIHKDIKNAYKKNQIGDTTLVTDKKKNKVSKDHAFHIVSGEVIGEKRFGLRDKIFDIGSNKVLDFVGEGEKNVYNDYKNPNDGIRDISPDTQAYDDVKKNRKNEGVLMKDLKDVDSINNYVGVQEKGNKVALVIDYQKNQRIDLNKFTVKSRLSFE